MPRTVNISEHAARREAIVDAVEVLVASVGYEAMTIQDVLAHCGISKGALYHYYGSKPELLEALVTRMTVQLAELGAEAAHEAALPAQERLRLVFLTITRQKAQNKPLLLGMLTAWYADSNAVLRQKLRTAGLQRFAPILADVIRDGVAEGVFTVVSPGDAGEILWGLAQDLIDNLSRLLLSPGEQELLPAMRAKVEAYTGAIARVLGMREGRFRLIDDTVLEQWAQAVEAR